MRRISHFSIGVIWIFLILSGCTGKEVVESSPASPGSQSAIQPGSEAARTGCQAEGSCEILWTSFVTSGTPVRDAFIIGENIYIETKECELYCLDARTGFTKWVIGLAGPLQARLVKSGGNFLAVTASLLIEIDPKRGYIVREERLPFSPSSGVALDGYNFYLSGWDGRLYTLDQNTLKMKMVSPLKGRVLTLPRLAQNLIICATEQGVIQAVSTLDGTTEWLFPRKRIMHKIRAKELWAGDVVAEDLKAQDGTVILAKGSSATVDTLETVEESKIGEVWIYVSKGVYELPTRTQFVGQVEVAREAIYAATTDAMLYCLSVRSGNLLWYANLPGPVVSGVIVRGDTIYVPTFESGLTALDRRSGKRKWWVKEAKDLLAFGEGVIYLLAPPRKIMVVEEATGSVLSSFALPRPATVFRGIINLDSQVLYLFTPEGRLYACETAE